MVKVLKYEAIDGIPTMKTSELIYLYNMIESEGSFKYLLPELQYVKVEDFLQIIFSAAIMLYVCIEGEEPVGVFWLNSISEGNVNAHGVVFKEYRSKSKEIFMAGVKHILHRYHTITFIVPKSNVVTQRFLKKIGVTRLGIVPQAMKNAELNVIEDIVVFYINREKHKQLIGE